MISRSLLPILVLTAVTALPCAAQTAAPNAPASSAQKPDSLLEARAALVVKGTGTAQVAPGRIWLTLTILGDGDTDDEAVTESRQNSDKATAIYQKILSSSVPLAWTKPTWMGLSQQEAQERKKSYRAATRVSISGLTDAAIAQKFVDALREAKLPGSVHVQADCGENRETGYNQALRQAVQRARERASILSEASQLTKIELLGLREGEAQTPSAITEIILQDRGQAAIPQRLTVRANVTLYWGVAQGGSRPTITAASRTAAKPTPKAPSRRP